MALQQIREAGFQGGGTAGMFCRGERFARSDFIAAQRGSCGGKSSGVIKVYFMRIEGMGHVLLWNGLNQVELYT